MKIVSVRVTDDDGIEHLWEGLTGYAIVRTFNKKGQPYQEALDVHLVLPAKPHIVAPKNEEMLGT